MSRHTNFAVVGAGTLGSFIIKQLLKDKASGTVKEVIVLTRQVKRYHLYVIYVIKLNTHWPWTPRAPRPWSKATPR